MNGTSERASATSSAVCPVCPHACRLQEGQVGRCRARHNVAGSVVAQNYGRLTSLALDPIEKKPLARFHPGSYVLSVGSYGCNLSCAFCQNASIAQVGATQVRWQTYSIDELIQIALELRSRGCIGLAYTYNEPLVGYEFVRDCAAAAHEAGLLNVLVSNGCASSGVIEELLAHLDAANIDLKGFNADIYRQLGGDFECVCRTITTLAQARSVHLELTSLIVPHMNDSDEDMQAQAAWLSSLDPSLVLHVTRFFPHYKMSDARPTPVSLVRHLADVARGRLQYVYCGNC